MRKWNTPSVTVYGLHGGEKTKIDGNNLPRGWQCLLLEILEWTYLLGYFRTGSSDETDTTPWYCILHSHQPLLEEEKNVDALPKYKEEFTKDYFKKSPCGLLQDAGRKHRLYPHAERHWQARHWEERMDYYEFWRPEFIEETKTKERTAESVSCFKKEQTRVQLTADAELWMWSRVHSEWIGCRLPEEHALSSPSCLLPHWGRGQLRSSLISTTEQRRHRGGAGRRNLLFIFLPSPTCKFWDFQVQILQLAQKLQVLSTSGERFPEARQLWELRGASLIISPPPRLHQTGRHGNAVLHGWLVMWEPKASSFIFCPEI